MSGKLKHKLKSKKGETITETLVSVLIAAAAMILFASMITSSQRILQKSERIMDAYYDGETRMEAAMAAGATTGRSEAGAAMSQDTEGAGKAGAAMSLDTEEAGKARTDGAADGIKTGTGTVIIKQTSGELSYGISNRHKNGEINANYATNQPGGSDTSTSGIERFALAEYKSQN